MANSKTYFVVESEMYETTKHKTERAAIMEANKLATLRDSGKITISKVREVRHVK